MSLIKDIPLLPEFFEHIKSRLDIDTLTDLDSIKKAGELSEPGYGRLHVFNNKITALIKSESKLFGIESTSPMARALLFKLFVSSWPDHNENDLLNRLVPNDFIVGNDKNPLPWVGGSRQGELDGVSYQEIVSVFGEPSSSTTSTDEKVQVEWELQFNNGVRSSIYDYKQYGTKPENVDYWSIGGNSPDSAVEVYLAMGLI